MNFKELLKTASKLKREYYAFRVLTTLLSGKMSSTNDYDLHKYVDYAVKYTDKLTKELHK